MLGGKEPGVNVGALLEALGSECAELSVISERIQTIVVSASAIATTGPSFHHHAQACDLLTQSLTAITYFLSEIAQRVPKEWTVDVVDVVENLPLSDLAAALTLTPKPDTREAAGSFELF